MLDLMMLLTHASQVGGLRGRCGDFATHQVRGRIDMCRTRKVHCLTVYVDLVAAFYRTIREIALPTATDDQDRLDIVKGLEVPPLFHSALLDLMNGEPTLSTAVESPHLLHQLTEAVSDTWFTIKGADKAARTRTGTRPGDNLATDLFNVIFARPLREIEEQIRTNQLGWDHHTGPSHMATTQPDQLDATTSFVDDLVAQSPCPDYKEVPRKLTALMTIIYTTLTKYGMQLNFKIGKTAAMVTIAGKGARALQEQVWEWHQRGLHIPQANEQLHVVYQYKHLGGQIRHDGNIMPEIKTRVYATTTALQPLRRVVFKQRALPTTQKIQYAEAYALSRLTYNAATWTNHNDATRRTFSTAYTAIYRAALQRNLGPHCDTDDMRILHLAAKPAPDTKLTHLRLLHLGRMLRHGSPTLHTLLDQLIHHGTSWGAQIQQDIHWLTQHTHDDDTISGPWQDWMRGATHNAKAWRRRCNKALEAATFQQQEQRACAHWRKQLQQHGLIIPAPHQSQTTEVDGAMPPPPTPPRTYICYDCGGTYNTIRGYRIHRNKHHKPPNDPARYVPDTTVCGSCKTTYGNRPKLLGHLRYSTKCWEAWRPTLTTLPDDTYQSLREAASVLSTANHRKGLPRKHSDMPFRRPPRQPQADSDGPPPPTPAPTTRATNAPHLVQQGNGHQAQHNSTHQVTSPARPTAPMCPFGVRLRRHTRATNIQSSDTDGNAPQSAPHSDSGGTNNSGNRRVTTGALCSDHMRMEAPRRFTTATTTVDDTDVTAHQTGPQETDATGDTAPFLDADTDQGHRRQLPCDENGVPIPFVEHPPPNDTIGTHNPPRPLTEGTLFFLHLFSGPRRRGDVQHHMESRARQHGLNLIVLSIDVVLNAQTADLQNPHTIKHWLNMIQQSRVIGLLAGPPCSTWSRARRLSITCCGATCQAGATCPTCHRRTPRPLRDALRPWGKEALTSRERKTLQLGNNLCRNTLLLATACRNMQAPFILEHPEATTSTQEASIWRLPETTALADHSDVQLTHFDQCTHGQRAIKPTTILHAYTPHLRTRLLARGARGRCNHARGHHLTLRGLHRPGQWNTSPAKTYPEEMCRAIAEEVIDVIKEGWPHICDHLDDPDLHGHDDLYQPLDEYGPQVTTGSDTFHSTWV